MRVLRYALAIGMVCAFASTGFAGGGGSKKHSRRVFDVCLNPATDARPNTEGSAFTAVAIILPGGTIPTGGVSDCSTLASQSIGTFFANGRFVVGLPNAGASDVAFVIWHFRLAKGSFDTMGPVESGPQGTTYPQTIVGATGGFGPAKGAAQVTTLDSSGYQFEIRLTGMDN